MKKTKPKKRSLIPVKKEWHGFTFIVHDEPLDKEFDQGDSDRLTLEELRGYGIEIKRDRD